MGVDPEKRWNPSIHGPLYTSIILKETVKKYFVEHDEYFVAAVRVDFHAVRTDLYAYGTTYLKNSMCLWTAGKK